jgi:ferric-dicitrate binding protein FerR (iron transport regulator)
MENNNQIPESDLELARKVGNLLEEGRSILSIDDPLTDQIIDYKKGLYSQYENQLYESKRNSWQKISGVIQNDLNESSATNIHKSSERTIGFGRSTFLKVAAVVLFGILISVIYIQFHIDQPKIVAQSDSTQIIHTLDDDSRVQLRPNSTLSIVEESDALVRYELEGEAFFDITKDENRQFLVNAGPGVIEVTGTSFNIREWTGETVVYLQEGSLSLNSSDNSKRIILKPGEAAKINSDFEISEPVQSGGEEFISWQRNEMVLTDRTVASIIKELEYHCSINLQVPEQIKTEILGGTLSLESKEVSLENLGIVLGGKFSSIGDDRYQFVE